MFDIVVEFLIVMDVFGVGVFVVLVFVNVVLVFGFWLV